MNTTIILVTGSGPGGLRQLVTLELPAIPLPGEHIEYGGRGYRALERSWRFVEVKEGDEVKGFGVAAGLLVEQISGPPHVVTSLGGAPN